MLQESLFLINLYLYTMYTYKFSELRRKHKEEADGFETEVNILNSLQNESFRVK